MIVLNHAFLAGVAHRPPDTAGLVLIEHVRRRIGALPLVHGEFVSVETGAGPFVQWANHARKDIARKRFVELLLRMTSGPFLDGPTFDGDIHPSVDGLAPWLQTIVRTVLATPPAAAMCGLVSPSPSGGADAPGYSAQTRAIFNWLSTTSFDRDLTGIRPGRTTIEILEEAESQMGGRLVVLPAARRSAAQWVLDCPAPDLHRALLGLEEYVNALREGLPREQCADRYHTRTGIPMSQESAATGKLPTRRRQREFEAGVHGKKYFDMHAKPGSLTRVHIWVPAAAEPDEAPVIYVGHCGKHLS